MRRGVDSYLHTNVESRPSHSQPAYTDNGPTRHSARHSAMYPRTHHALRIFSFSARPYAYTTAYRTINASPASSHSYDASGWPRRPASCWDTIGQGVDLSDFGAYSDLGPFRPLATPLATRSFEGFELVASRAALTPSPQPVSPPLHQPPIHSAARQAQITTHHKPFPPRHPPSFACPGANWCGLAAPVCPLPRRSPCPCPRLPASSAPSPPPMLGTSSTTSCWRSF